MKPWNGPENENSFKVYPSGLLSKAGGTIEAEVLDRAQLGYVCLSYFYIKYHTADEVRRIFDVIKKYGTRVFLDSGAYTYQKNKALTRREVDETIDQYAEWVLEAGFKFDFIATFDYLRQPEAVLWATKRLEDCCLRPMPVYHLGTSITALRELIDKGYTLIGIGGLVPFRAGVALPFLDHVFNAVERYGRGVRLHGLGINSNSAIYTYPWFSVDSSAAVLAGASGKIFVPSRDPRKVIDTVPVSSKLAAFFTEKWHDCREDRIVHNLQITEQLVAKRRPVKPTARRKALF